MERRQLENRTHHQLLSKFQIRHRRLAWGGNRGLEIDVQARCARYQVLNVDPETAEKDKKEPWDTLVSYRRVDEGIKWKPCFGMLSCPRNEGPIEVGMRFEVVETTEGHRYIKGF